MKPEEKAVALVAILWVLQMLWILGGLVFAEVREWMERRAVRKAMGVHRIPDFEVRSFTIAYDPNDRIPFRFKTPAQLVAEMEKHDGAQ